MGKVIGILLLVLGVWMATQFAAGTSPLQSETSRSESANLMSDSGAKVQAALDQGSARVDRLLEE